MNRPLSLAGQFLLAMPGIGDPRFARAAIALCVHDDDGALGIDLGQEIEGLGLHEMLDQLGIDRGAAPDGPVCMGGPVEPGRGFVVHSRDWMGEGTLDVGGRWALSGSLDVLKAIAAGRGPAAWIVALGYAGWGPGQLDEEMGRHGWLNLASDAAMMFDRPAADRWFAALVQANIDPAMLASDAGRA